MPKFSVGQLVTCIMYEGVYVVHCITEGRMGRLIYHRYTIRRGEEFIDDNPEVWLSPARVSFPQMRIINNSKFPLALSPQSPIKRA